MAGFAVPSSHGEISFFTENMIAARIYAWRQWSLQLHALCVMGAALVFAPQRAEFSCRRGVPDPLAFLVMQPYIITILALRRADRRSNKRLERHPYVKK
jgi:hypothetical protein